VLAPIRDDVAAAVAHFVSFEVGLIYTPCRIRPLAAVWHGALVAVVRMERVVHIAVEFMWTMKPRASPNKDTPSKPFRAVIADGSTVIWRHIVITIRAFRCNADIDTDLRLSPLGHCRETASCNSG